MITPTIKIDAPNKQITFNLTVDSPSIYNDDENFNLFKKISNPDTPIDECLTYMGIMFSHIIKEDT